MARNVDTTQQEEGKGAQGGDKAFRDQWPLPEGAQPVRPGGAERDPVEEASEESFPASDPPAFTPAKIG